MTANKLDAVKDGKLISLLKRMLKEIKAFVKTLLKQREVEIDKLPDNMTLGDLSDLLAYSNNKLILPGHEVVYTTPDNQKFKTYSEASNHISFLSKISKDFKVDLDKVQLDLSEKSFIGKVDPLTDKVIEDAKYTKGSESRYLPEENQYEPGEPAYFTLLFEDGTKEVVTEDNLAYEHPEVQDFYNTIRRISTGYVSPIQDFLNKNSQYEKAKRLS